MFDVAIQAVAIRPIALNRNKSKPFFEDQPFGVMITNNAEKAIVLNSELIPQKSTRTSVGVLLMKLRPKQIVVSAKRGFEESLANVARYTKTKIPASGTVLEEKDLAELQISLL